MSIIYVLIPVAILLTALGIYLFFWAVRTNQFTDLEKQGMSILFDNNNSENKTSSASDNMSQSSSENEETPPKNGN
ncbi:MAG: cbb3-type cytochrome oxidase maturation protein [Alteromonadaceae bacterium]|jgi:cbb3-type cytochrome oxidase maturation protein|tara:strand:+ start:6706 stop:6933 length:228 start_codon:yes stop_codon:yes gene_type:complete